MDVSFGTIALLSLVAFVAGVVDAIAGGGGLLTIPALLTAGLPPHLAFGTNKGSAVWGSGSALVRFWRAGLIDEKRVVPLFALGFAGSLLGAALVLLLTPAALRPVVLVLLLGAGAAVAFLRPPAEAAQKPVSRRGPALSLVAALLIGAYDGFFGPGTGTFLIVAFVAFLHLPLPRATANAKVVNFASNLAALGLFAARGVVVWKVALPMAFAQLLGGALGAHFAIKGGHVLIRRVVLVVVLALVARLGYDLIHAA